MLRQAQRAAGIRGWWCHAMHVSGKLDVPFARRKIAVRRFESDYTAPGAPELHVVLDCIIGRREGREVIASFVASGSARAAANRLSEVVSAFEQASAAALNELSQQAAQAVRAARSAAQNAESPAPSISRASQ